MVATIDQASIGVGAGQGRTIWEWSSQSAGTHELTISPRQDSGRPVVVDAVDVLGIQPETHLSCETLTANSEQ